VCVVGVLLISLSFLAVLLGVCSVRAFLRGNWKRLFWLGVDACLRTSISNPNSPWMTRPQKARTLSFSLLSPTQISWNLFGYGGLDALLLFIGERS